MGGDGTILTALRHYAGTGVPVFAVNFGEVGFLATIDPDGLPGQFDRAFAGGFETLELPTIAVGRPEGRWTAMNDISIHRKPGHRVADLAYGLAGEEIGRVRCDGLVVATPQGSTGYNLANGGPVMAWGVEGYVVSFVAPHSLTARALVVAPGDLLTINNASREEPVEVHVDGRPTCELPPGEDLHIEFADSHGTLAQLPGASFYHRLARAVRPPGAIAPPPRRYPRTSCTSVGCAARRLHSKGWACDPCSRPSSPPRHSCRRQRPRSRHGRIPTRSRRWRWTSWIPRGPSRARTAACTPSTRSGSSTRPRCPGW